MLESGTLNIDGELVSFFPDVRGSKDFPRTLQFWMAYVARELLQLGVLFRATAIMLQVPGAAEYRYAGEDHGLDDASWTLVERSGRKTLLDALAFCLDAVGAGDLMKQVPGGEDHVPGELPEEWKALIRKSRRVEHGLLNVIAGCLDELVVKPGMKEIDVESRPAWWQKWWGTM